MYLYTEKGIVCGASVFKAELSDFFGIVVQREKIDPHLFYCDIMQISTGKTNKGMKLHGCVGRHKNVLQCPIGAKGFYFLIRFQVTNEFAFVPNFHNNASWFDMKLLIDSTTKDTNVSVSNTTYAKQIMLGCKEAGCFSNHQVHLGRVQGTMQAELEEDDMDQTRYLWNWDPKTQEKSYSTKLPLQAMRRRAGFLDERSYHCNPQTVKDPSEELQKMIFPWLDVAFKSFHSNVDSANQKGTAGQWLKSIKMMQIIILQDAAAMYALHPSRMNHQLFHVIAVFKTKEFQSYCTEMKEWLSEAEDPLNTSIELALPGVNNRLNEISNDRQKCTR